MVNKKVVAVVVGVVAVIAIGALAYTTLGSITIEEALYAETPRALAIYMKVYNGKLREVCLVKAELAEPGMAMVEIHETIMREGGVHEMRPVEKLCIPPRGVLEMKPGGYHIMIMGESETLKAITADKIVTVKLTFNDGTQIEVKARPVQQAGEHSYDQHHH